MVKHTIRQQLLVQRKQLDEKNCQDLSLRIQQSLIDADCFSRAETLALYSPINNEVRTDHLLAVARQSGKQVCYPRVCGEALQFVQVVSVAELAPGAFGVAEPKSGGIVPVGEIDLVVVPGVAFDLNGYRLGYGKGFYDRELSRVTQKTASVGLCYEFQLCEELPVEEHDQQLDYIATEMQLIPCRKNAAGSQ